MTKFNNHNSEELPKLQEDKNIESEIKEVLLDPAQLIAMIDYPPLHSPEAFLEYLKKFNSGQDVEPIVVIPKDRVIRHLAKKENLYNTYKLTLQEFLATHPLAEYFMLGGKHRSAAATVLGMKIPSYIISDDSDVAKIHDLISKGKLTGVPSVGRNFEDSLRELEEHYSEHKRFWTMDEKTEEMAKNGDISNKF